MNLNKQFRTAAICSALALSMTVAALADSVLINFKPTGQEVTTLSNYANGETIYSTQINAAAQGTMCHGLRVQPSGYVDGYTIAQVDNNSVHSVYLFTGPSCDGYAHTAQAGQTTQLDNSNHTSHNVLIKSYYYR